MRIHGRTSKPISTRRCHDDWNTSTVFRRSLTSVHILFGLCSNTHRRRVEINIRFSTVLTLDSEPLRVQNNRVDARDFHDDRRGNGIRLREKKKPISRSDRMFIENKTLRTTPPLPSLKKISFR